MWEKPVFLIQPQQGIKSTLCLCVMQGFAGLDRSLDINVGRVPPLSRRCHVYILQVLNMILVLLSWSTVPLKEAVSTCDHSSQVAYIYR